MPCMPSLPCAAGSKNHAARPPLFRCPCAHAACSVLPCLLSLAPLARSGAPSGFCCELRRCVHVPPACKPAFKRAWGAGGSDAPHRRRVPAGGLSWALKGCPSSSPSGSTLLENILRKHQLSPRPPPPAPPPPYRRRSGTLRRSRGRQQGRPTCSPTPSPTQPSSQVRFLFLCLSLRLSLSRRVPRGVAARPPAFSPLGARPLRLRRSMPSLAQPHAGLCR